jgi:hypothetical protein
VARGTLRPSLAQRAVLAPRVRLARTRAAI